MTCYPPQLQVTAAAGKRGGGTAAAVRVVGGGNLTAVPAGAAR